MRRYFFDFQLDRDRPFLVDDIGVEFADPDQARAQGLRSLLEYALDHHVELEGAESVSVRVHDRTAASAVVLCVTLTEN